VPYAGIVLACALGAWAISRGVVIEPPAWISRLIDGMTEVFKQRKVAAAGQQP
jgi:hypothetical protein